MRRDTTQFRERFKRWKEGLPAYKNGKPIEIENNGVTYNVHPSAIGASELNVTAPEIVVTGRDRRPTWKRMYQNPRLGDTSQYYNGDAIRNITDWAPGIGDVSQGFDAYHAAKNGNYGEAAMLGGLLLLPNVIEKPLKAAGKVIKMLPDIDFSYSGASGDSKELMKKIVGMAARDELAGTLDDASRKLYGIEKGKTYTKYPSVVVDNLTNSIFPRMKAMRPWVKEKDFDRMFTQAADGKWTIHPSSTFKKAYGDDTSVIGLYTDNGNIAINANAPDLDDVLLHEIRHKLDAGIPLTQEEEAYLRAAYGDIFTQIPKTDPSWTKTGIGEDYDIWNEAVTTNRDARDVVLGPVHSRMTPVNLQNKIIDNVSDQMILEAVSRSNGYGRRYVDALIGDGPLDASLVSKEQIQAWRNAMKYVGSGALAVGLSRPLLFNTHAE